jgi:hypothetical protein
MYNEQGLALFHVKIVMGKRSTTMVVVATVCVFI